MSIQHEENKALGTWRNKESCDDQPDRNGIAGAGYTSHIDGSKPLGICGESRERANTFVKSGRTVPGEAIDELIENILEQLADSEIRTEKLKNQLDKIRSIRSHIDLSNDIK
jgi:hypothetical protein